MSEIARPLRLYLRLAFGICWGVGLVMLMLPLAEGIPRVAIWFLAVAGGPTIAALAAARASGREVLAQYAARIARPGGPWLLVGPVLILSVHLLAATCRGAPLHGNGVGTLISGVVATTLVDPGPLEEFGWRGFLQPLLRRRFSVLVSSLIVGVVWGIWHLPALVLPGFPQHDPATPLPLAIGRFLLQTTALSVVMGHVVDRARGAVAPAILMHWAANQGAAGHLSAFDPSAWTVAITATALLVVAALPPRPDDRSG